MTDLSVTEAGRLSQADPQQRLQAAARQFESFFIKELMKSAEREDPFFGGSPAMRQYQQMLDDGLAEHAAGSLGIAELLLQELGPRAALHNRGGSGR